MKNTHFPTKEIEMIKDSIDCNLYFFEKNVPTWVMAIIIVGSVLFFTGLFVIFHLLTKKKKPLGI